MRVVKTDASLKKWVVTMKKHRVRNVQQHESLRSAPQADGVRLPDNVQTHNYIAARIYSTYRLPVPFSL
jgi:hypothetical protein